MISATWIINICACLFAMTKLGIVIVSCFVKLVFLMFMQLVIALHALIIHLMRDSVSDGENAAGLEVDVDSYGLNDSSLNLNAAELTEALVVSHEREIHSVSVAESLDWDWNSESSYNINELQDIDGYVYNIDDDDVGGDGDYDNSDDNSETKQKSQQKADKIEMEEGQENMKEHKLRNYILINERFKIKQELECKEQIIEKQKRSTDEANMEDEEEKEKSKEKYSIDKTKMVNAENKIQIIEEEIEDIINVYGPEAVENNVVVVKAVKERTGSKDVIEIMSIVGKVEDLRLEPDLIKQDKCKFKEIIRNGKRKQYEQENCKTKKTKTIPIEAKQEEIIYGFDSLDFYGKQIYEDMGLKYVPVPNRPEFEYTDEYRRKVWEDPGLKYKHIPLAINIVVPPQKTWIRKIRSHLRMCCCCFVDHKNGPDWI